VLSHVGQRLLSDPKENSALLGVGQCCEVAPHGDADVLLTSPVQKGISEGDVKTVAVEGRWPKELPSGLVEIAVEGPLKAETKAV
jgi:hypothetical protein